MWLLSVAKTKALLYYNHITTYTAAWKKKLHRVAQKVEHNDIFLYRR